MESAIDTTDSTIEIPLSTDVKKSPPIQNKELEPINARKVLTKIDLRLLPILSLGCLLAFLDRISIGNAEVYGLSKDLNMEGTQFNVALLIFFIPYILLEVSILALFCQGCNSDKTKFIHRSPPICSSRNSSPTAGLPSISLDSG
jgi:hypothetical protein